MARRSSASDEGQRRPTIVSVAKLAGVSIASASRVLNHGQGSPETIRRVREAAEAVGYRASSSARSLKLRRTEQVAVSVPDIANPVYVAMVGAVEHVLASQGYRLVIHSTGGSVEADVEIVRSLADEHVDGLIMTPLRPTEALHEAVATAQAPIVMAGSLSRDVEVDTVQSAGPRAAELATQHLIDEGRQRIAFVGGAADTVPGRDRLRGYKATLRRAKLRFDPALVIPGRFDLVSGVKAVDALQERTGPDALFCANDLVALGAMHRLRELGVAVPDAVAVVGVDDSILGAMAYPPLSSVSVNAPERGRLAAGLLLERIADPSRVRQRLTIEPVLVVRESSVRPPAGARHVDEPTEATGD